MDHRVTPPLLIGQAKAWYSAYTDASSGNRGPAIIYYSYMTAAEFWFKTEITLRDSTYGEVGKLRTVGHDFQKMLSELERTAGSESDIFKTAKQLADDSWLLSLDMIDIKYPYAPRLMSYPERVLNGGDSVLKGLIDTTDAKRKEMSDWITMTRGSED